MQAHTIDLARGLAEAGHEVEVVTARHPAGSEAEEYEGNRWHFVPVPTRYEHFPMRHHAWLRGSVAKFETLHATRPFDVVHSESTSALGLLQRRVHRRVPVAVKFHGNWLGLVSAALRRAQRGDAGRKVAEAKHLIWISGHHFVPPGTVYRFRACEAMVPSQQQLDGTRRSYLLHPSRVHVVPNGVDVRRYRLRQQASARARLALGDGPILLCVGRLVREKGIHLAIEALVGIPESRLVIVGDGEEQSALEALASRLKIADRVVFAGSQPPETVATYMAAADVFLFPTERDEAAPVVLPEAMASGLPVIASDMGGITEVIDHPGETGVLVPPGDVRALSAAATRLLKDSETRGRMGRAARRRVEAEYTIERMVERTTEVYEVAQRRLGASP